MFIDQFYSMVDTISASIWPPFIAGCLIGFPSVCLYSAQLFVILTNWRHFNSSYFVVFALRAGLSLGNFFTSFIAHRIGRVGLGYALMMEYAPSWTLALGTFLMYYSFHLENLTTALLLLNRLTSVLFPLGYEKFWHIFLPIAFGFTILCPLPFTMPVFWLEWVVELDVERTPFAGNNFSFTLNNNVPKDYPLPKLFLWSYTTICAYSGAAFLVVSLLLNLATLWAFMRTKAPTSISHQVRGGNNPPNQQQQKMERKLTVYTLITFIGQFIFSLYMILMRSRYFEPNHDKQERLYLAIFNQYGWVSDLCTIAIPSWSLIWANKKSRDLIFGKLFTKVCKNVTIATTAVVPLAGGPPSYMNAGGRTNSWQAHWTDSSRLGNGRRPTTTVFGHGEHFPRMETT